jgi:hypothetical protein
MFARGPHTRLICLALLATLVISCGGPSVSAVPPTPPPTTERALETTLPPPKDGLAQAPVVPPRRPGGAPPGTALVTVPGDDDLLSGWRSDLDDIAVMGNPTTAGVLKAPHRSFRS